MSLHKRNKRGLIADPSRPRTRSGLGEPIEDGGEQFGMVGHRVSCSAEDFNSDVEVVDSLQIVENVDAVLDRDDDVFGTVDL